jgi:hypothetical protein
MQNAGLYRRGIVLPFDEDAEEALRSNDASKTTRVCHLEITFTIAQLQRSQSDGNVPRCKYSPNS